MGLNTLNKVLEKKGLEYVNQLLDNDIIITEKLDTFRILFENVKGKLKFFKKDNAEITLIERTLTNIWEKALIEIPVIINEMKLPEGIRFGVSYTPVERPIRIPYSNLPRYVLTDVTKREENKVIEVYEYDEVKKWAQLLNMARPPIIFEGKLSKDQKNIILSYSNKDFSGNETNFSKMIENRIGKTYSGEDTIEGIIIKGKDNLSQVISYEFELLDEAYKSSYNNNSRDLYDLVLLSLNEFMNDYNIPQMEANSSDQIYINIISDIFNQYCAGHHISESLDPKYLTPPSYGHSGKLNTKFIENEKTIELLKKGPIYESMFKIILSSFRKYKKEYGLLNEKAAEKFNTHVYRINGYSNKFNESFDKKMSKELQLLNESKLQESDNIVIKAFDKKKVSDTDNMRVIASIQKSFNPKNIKVIRGADPCIIYITDLTPFTKSQMENIYAMNRSWKVPVLIATVGSSRRVKGKKFFLSDSLLNAQLDSITIFNKDIIPNYFLLEDWDLKELFEFARPKYEPIALITDKGKKSDFIVQLYFEDEIMGGRINAEPEFNIGEMEVDDKLKAFRNIEDNLFYTFKEYTPQAIHGLYNSMVSEYKSWSGEVPSPIKGEKAWINK